MNEIRKNSLHAEKVILLTSLLLYQLPSLRRWKVARDRPSLQDEEGVGTQLGATNDTIFQTSALNRFDKPVSKRMKMENGRR